MLYYHTPHRTLRSTLAALGLALTLALPAQADVPHVATDIAPVHALVAQVMRGLGTPDLILPPGADPHGHALRPSEAAALERADLVIWIGPALTPWLERPLTTLAGNARQRVLMDVDGTIHLPMREGAGFEGHDHGHNHSHDQDGAAIDPHVWLDPDNALLWLATIADDLTAVDPENAALYATNAAEGQARIRDAEAQARAVLAPFRDTPFVVMHDAYHYFEAHFGLSARAAISSGDAARPSPARLDEVRHTIKDSGARCIIAQTVLNTGLINAVLPGGTAKVSIIDPLGTQLEQGAGLYPDLLSIMAVKLAECLQE